MEPAPLSFRIRADYTDTELDALIALHHPAPADPLSLPTILLAAAAALAGAFLAEALGATPPRDGTVALLLFAAVWAGVGLGRLAAWREARRNRALLRDAWRGALAGLTIRVSPQGVVARRADGGVALAWAAVEAAELHQGLLVLHGAAGAVIALPARLLTPAQCLAVMRRAAPLDD